MTDMFEEWLTARWEAEHLVAPEVAKTDYRVLRLIAEATRGRITEALVASRVAVAERSLTLAAR